MKYLGLLSLLFLVNCSDDVSFEYIGCTVIDNKIVCPDGSNTVIPVPTNGVDGRDGQDGEKGDKGDNGNDGTILAIIDPCGDYIHANNPNHQHSVDEIILYMNDGTYLAWYKNVGFTVLQENTNYQTTDKQKCNFRIENGQVIEL